MNEETGEMGGSIESSAVAYYITFMLIIFFINQLQENEENVDQFSQSPR